MLYFATAVVQTITGFGGGVLAMPFGMMLVGRQTAAGQINLLGLLLSILIAIKERANIQWRFLTTTVAWMGLGIAAGVLMQRYLNFAVLYRMYGGFILLSVAILAFGKNKQPFSAVVNIIILVSAGIIHQLFVSGGPLLVLYTIRNIPEKEPFRATINGIWVPVNTLLLLNHWRTGVYTNTFFTLTALLIPALALGIAVGNLLYQRVNAKLFLFLTYILLMVMGLYILL